MEHVYLAVALAAIAGGFFLESMVRRATMHSLPAVPPKELDDSYAPGEFSRFIHYTRARLHFGNVQGVITSGAIFLFIALGGIGLTDFWAASLATSLGFDGFNAASMSGDIVRGLIFLVILAVLSAALGLPFTLYDTFVLEERYGFNRTTWKTFLLDRIKGAILTALLGGPLIALVIAAFHLAGSWAWLAGWAVASAFSLLMLWLGPSLLLPLFNKFEPLEEGELRSDIEKYCSAQNVDVTGVFVMDGSRRSSRSNAFVTGLGSKKRIALFDTLMESLQTNEIVAVLAHEVGHYTLGHIPRTVALSLIRNAALFFLLGLALADLDLYASFGVTGMPVAAGLVCFGLVIAPLSYVLGVVDNALSRKHERQADAYAARTLGKALNIDAGASLAGALKKLTTDNLANPSPPRIAVVLHHSHPPLLERIRSLRSQAA